MLTHHRIVAVIRQATQDNIIPIVQALYDGHIRCIEVTAETPHAMSLIEKVSTKFGDKMIVGAGTVLDAMTARNAISSGASFIVSPTTNSETIKTTKRYGVLSIPGALTPTEILKAYELGADIIKVFPANMFGPRYVRDIHGPFPYIPMMVTGGITLDNLTNYLDNGAIAVGVGSQLVNASLLNNEGDFVRLTKTALQFNDRIIEDN